MISAPQVLQMVRLWCDSDAGGCTGAEVGVDDGGSGSDDAGRGGGFAGAGGSAASDDAAGAGAGSVAGLGDEDGGGATSGGSVFPSPPLSEVFGGRLFPAGGKASSRAVSLSCEVGQLSVAESSAGGMLTADAGGLDEETASCAIGPPELSVHATIMLCVRDMAQRSGRILVVYDGRDSGSTVQAIRFAHVNGKKVRVVSI